MPKLITLKTLADHLGVGPNTLRYQISRGKLPAGQKLGRERIFMPAEATTIRNWVALWKKVREGSKTISKKED